MPLPLPYLGLFAGSGPKLTSARWRRLRNRRLLHVIVCAINFVFARALAHLRKFFGGHPIPTSGPATGAWVPLSPRVTPEKIGTFASRSLWS